MSWLPRRMTVLTRHSIDRGDSPTAGQAQATPGTCVSPVAAHLSVSRPERTPQKSVARAMSAVVRFTVNSISRLIMAWECRSGRTDMYSIGGLVHTVPVHAAVIRLASSPRPQLTSMAGNGYTIVPGFQFTFAIYYFRESVRPCRRRSDCSSGSAEQRRRRCCVSR